jgi:hypothetical protein
MVSRQVGPFLFHEGRVMGCYPWVEISLHHGYKQIELELDRMVFNFYFLLMLLEGLRSCCLMALFKEMLRLLSGDYEVPIRESNIHMYGFAVICVSE